MTGAAVVDDLGFRGLLQDHTEEAALRDLLEPSGVSVYHGIDPTAPSLHLGNLIGVLVLRRFQDAGHRPIALVGGATGMIGDPSGRSGERNLLDEAELATNLAGIRSQLQRLLDFGGAGGAELVNNYDWTRDVTLLEFLRDAGKHLTVNQMVAKESIRSRMASDAGISFTEFSYMLLQAFDFWWLHENRGCSLQIGGSDQWGNITAGIDLIRKRGGARAHGLTWPLMTRSDGSKFGKTAQGAVWLDPALTSPYEFHQYFLRVSDADVERTLLQLTLLGVGDVSEIMRAHLESPEHRLAQHELADSITALIHGPVELRRAKRAAAVLFGGGDLDSEGLESLRGIVPESLVAAGSVGADEPVVDLLVATGVCTSRSDARRSVKGGGIKVNGRAVTAGSDSVALIGGRFALLQRGRKQRHLAVFGG
ncbi:MAG: tyrosine--tRNA ligase [Acidimicrobiaceae bacterium]|nr:tyrosine--tRNA ligase [Acidimicrobiia bacterium]MCY4493942.1 tyrosine--tRNA ligase [Acidimicrobiaceae bacterium]